MEYAITEFVPQQDECFVFDFKIN